MKKLNSRCPLQSECERVCKYECHELDCDYYDANARPGLMIPDQEHIREKKFTDHEYELYEDEKDHADYKCGSCSIGHWYSGEYAYVSVVTPSGGTEKRPCETHTHYCQNFAEGQRKIDGDSDFDPEDAPGWCPRWEEDRLKENTGLRNSVISMREQPEPAPFVPERTIQAITLEIKTLHRQAQQIVVTYVIEIGRRLVEAKSMLNHGEWGDWLKNEFEFSQRTANDFMRIFEEYGASQMGLFGGEANSQTFANLSYSKALKLIAIPADEREEFAQANHVEELSTRELDKLIKERDEERKAKELAEEQAESMEEQLKKSSDRMNELQDRLLEVKRQAEESQEETDRLERELEDLKSKPVDVAVQATDPAELEAARKEAAAAARKEAEEQLKKKIEAADKKRKDAEAEVARLKEKQQTAEASAKAAQEQAQKEKAAAEEAARREKETAQARLETLEKQLKAAGNLNVQAFKFHFEAAQGNFNKMLDCLKELELDGDAAMHNKMLDALAALAKTMQDKAPKRMEA